MSVNLVACLYNQVTSLVVVNSLWMVVMLVFTSAGATSLNLLGTNPLGLVFLMLFGGLFALQFVSMLFHRSSAFVEALSGKSQVFIFL